MMKYELEWQRLRREDEIVGTMHDVADQKRTMGKKLKGQTPGQHLSVMLSLF